MKRMIWSAIMAGFAAVVLVIVAHAQDPYPRDVCSPGYVWRDAFRGDDTCVTPKTAAQVAYDNEHACEHVDPDDMGGALYDGCGTTCLPPYVPRLAGPNDHVCVTQQVHDQAIDDNNHAADRLDKKYYYPRWGNGDYRLDWCLNWNSVGCGSAAAENFCRHRMWTGARDFAEQPNIGASQPTQGMFFESDEVCNQSDCDGFKYITCYGKIPSERVFANPRIQARWNGSLHTFRLDACYNRNADCGKKAADAYCYQETKYTKATYFAFDDSPSDVDTLTIGSYQICDANDYYCYAFQKIICK